MRKTFILFTFLFISSALFAQTDKSPLFNYEPESQSSCRYSYKDFVNEVKSLCRDINNKEQCIALAKECGHISGKDDKPVSLGFMSEVEPSILKAMFEAGLEVPLRPGITSMSNGIKRGKFLCDMVINYDRGNLPFDNFKAIYDALGFSGEEYYGLPCGIKGMKYLQLRPHELAGVLGNKTLTDFFISEGVQMHTDLITDIPLDIWLGDYYKTSRSSRLESAINNPKNIIMIDDNTDFSVLMPKGTELLLVGEAHHGKYYKAVQDIINGLKCNPGLTHFASEFLMEMQGDDIEEFRRTDKVCKVKITGPYSENPNKRNIFKTFNETNQACLSALGCDTEILPLERTERILGHMEENNAKAKKEFRKLFDEPTVFNKKKKKLALIKYGERTVSEDGLSGRNYEWADILNGALEVGRERRIFAYMGKAHSRGYSKDFAPVGYMPSVADLVRQRGHNVKVLSISGGKYDLLGDAYLFRRFNLQDKYFLFIVPDSLKQALGVDFILHLPTTGEQEKHFKAAISDYKANY